MEHQTYRNLQKQSQQLVAQLHEESGLSKHLCANIIQYAKCLPIPGTHDIDENVFSAEMMNRFDLTSQYMISLMYQSLRAEKRHVLSVEDYCKCVCVFLADDIDKKIEFTFKVYDVNKDGHLSHIELYTLLKPCIVTPSEHEDMDVEDCLKELIELVMTTTDTNEDNFINLEEYRDLVKRNVLYLQLLGPCLPPTATEKRFKDELERMTEWETKRKYENVRAETLNSLENKNPFSDLYPVTLEFP